MPLTENIKTKADALIAAVQQDAPNLYSRLAAILQNINISRAKAGLAPLSAKEWVLESLISTGIGPEMAAIAAQKEEEAKATAQAGIEAAVQGLRDQL